MNSQVDLLLVDDNVYDTELAFNVIETEYPELKKESINDSEYALKHFRSLENEDRDSLPGFILLDIKMPKVTGFEVLSFLKSSDNLKQIPVIIFSSSGQESDIIKAYNLGCNAYVVKPVDFDEYYDTLQKTVEFWSKISVLK